MYRFTMAHAMKGRKVLRQAAGMWEETFDEGQFVGMLSEEIRALRSKCLSWEEISALLRANAHIEIDPAILATYCADVRRKRQAAGR